MQLREALPGMLVIGTYAAIMATLILLSGPPRGATSDGRPTSQQTK